MTTIKVGAVTRELTQAELDAIEYDRALDAMRVRMSPSLIAGSIVAHYWRELMATP